MPWALAFHFANGTGSFVPTNMNERSPTCSARVWFWFLRVRSTLALNPPPNGRPLCNFRRKPLCRGAYMDQPGPRLSRASTQRSDRFRPARDGGCRGEHPDAQHDELPTRVLCVVATSDHRVKPPRAEVLRPTADERDEYLDGNTDTNVVDDTPLGMLDWFDVHGASINNTNKLRMTTGSCASILFDNGDTLPVMGPLRRHVFSGKLWRRVPLTQPGPGVRTRAHPALAAPTLTSPLARALMVTCSSPPTSSLSHGPSRSPSPRDWRHSLIF